MGAGVSEITEKEGTLRFSDGSSIYSFYENGSFQLNPCGMSGRTIKGSWKEVDGFIRVEGEWSWVNGFSEADDFRVMRMHVIVDPSRPNKTAGMNDVPVSQVYFTIESIQKVKPTQPISALRHLHARSPSA